MSGQPPPPGYYPPAGPQGGAYPSANYGPPPQGNYGQYQPAADPQHVVLTNQPQPVTTVVVQSPTAMARPQNYLILAIFTTICCNLIFGIIAIIFSVMSTSDADRGDIEGARSKGKISMGLSIAGIIITVLIIIFVIIYFTVIVTSVYSAVANTYG